MRFSYVCTLDAVMVGPLGSSGGHLGPYALVLRPSRGRNRELRPIPDLRPTGFGALHSQATSPPPTGRRSGTCAAAGGATGVPRPGALGNLRYAIGCTHQNSERHTKDLPKAFFRIDHESSLQIGARPTQTPQKMCSPISEVEMGGGFFRGPRSGSPPRDLRVGIKGHP